MTWAAPQPWLRFVGQIATCKPGAGCSGVIVNALLCVGAPPMVSDYSQHQPDCSWRMYDYSPSHQPDAAATRGVLQGGHLVSTDGGRDGGFATVTDVLYDGTTMTVLEEDAIM